MDQPPDSTAPETLSLIEIAAWQFKELAPPKRGIVAGIPSLQRGAVWNAGQVELLWDSILRGFPIGSLVVCKKLDQQGTHSGKHGSGWSDEDVSHHLLDGQQRCNAIALAFVNSLEPSEPDGKPPPATLWIDLAPEVPKGSTRQFLLRMLTTAHPWGYTKHDKPDSLGIAEIRAAVKEYGSGKRPDVTASWPHASHTPIPFAWLSDIVFGNGQSDGVLWAKVLLKCRKFAGRKWADQAAVLIAAHLDQSATSKHLTRIASGLENAKRFTLVALDVPQGALREQSLQEEEGESSDADNGNRIYNVEHLFQRLNSAGTELRGEELLFSMIKAYWPTIEQSFDLIQDKQGNRCLPMPGSRLAMLGARAALIGFDGKEGLPAPFNISRIRGLAFAKTDTAKAERAQLEKYLGLTHLKAKADVGDSDLHRNLRQIDAWLLFDDSAKDDCGLPPVLRASLAQGAPDVFLLLLHLAQKVRNDALSNDKIAALRKPILGLATALHWFGDDRTKAIATLYADHFATATLTPASFAGVLKHCLQPQVGRREILKLLSPDQLDALIPKASHSDERLWEWNLFKLIVEAESDPEVRSMKHQNEWQFFCRSIDCKPMLLYAQRALLSGSRLGNYDPSRIDIWEDKNRPWDYDHLLPTNALKGNQGTYRQACRQWSNTIGNFRAWPLEENRSRHDELANESIITAEDRVLSKILDQRECDGFSLSWSQVDDALKASEFMAAARSRFLRIYSDWFDSLKIGCLLSDDVGLR